MKKLVLIDGNSLINRAFYAMPPLSAKDGTPTNAVLGFIKMLFKLIGDDKPEYIAVAFDVHHPTFRHEMFSEYKGTRKPMPEDLRPQIPLLKEVLSILGIYTVEKPGFEADDIIGTIAKATSVKTEIITGDRDSFQLVDDETEVHFTKRGISDVDVYTVENFTEKTGITPSQIIELKALMGDSSDNIPGISGVGEKTALTLVQTYGSVDGLYQHVDELKGKLKEKVENGKDSAYLSRTLATIDTKVDIEVDLDKMRYQVPFTSDVKRRFFELGFNSLLAYDKFFTSEEESTDLTDTLPPESAPKNTVDITSESDFIAVLDKNAYAVDFGKNLTFYDLKDTEYKVVIKELLFDEGLTFSELTNGLKKLFSSDKKLIVYDKKALRHKLNELGVDFSVFADDVSIMKYLADFSERENSLEEVIYAYNLDKNHPAFALSKIYETLKDKLSEDGVYSLYTDVELPLADVLYDMEVTGFKVDIKALDELSEEYRGYLLDAEKKIHALAGDDTFNINSPKQLGHVLFEKLQLPYPKKKKDGAFSTNQEILEGLVGDFPIVDEILKYRQLQKLLSTYIEGFRPVIEKATGLIHTTFNQTLTVTGRLSSKAPNLQNIPVRDDMGKAIRKFFVARDDEHILVGADYSQIELRLLAAFSGCPELVRAYNNDEDIHTQTASRVFDVPYGMVTKAQRRDAKAVNFGIIYGISNYGLAKNIKTTPRLAQEYINKYFETYPEVRAYMDKNVEMARSHGYVTTFLGRRRYLRDINSKNFNLRSFSERAAMNMPLQGSSADIIKVAMINVFNRLKAEGLKSKLILQVHDELIIDAYKSEQEVVSKLLKEEMENAVKLAVPLTVETEIGETWFDAK